MASPALDPQVRAVAHELADAARASILPHFRSATLQTDNKLQGDFDPVTEADRAAERAMRDILSQRRPNDGILGEEYGPQDGTSGLTWVLDPIDGTRGFIAGTPTWGVLIAVRDADGPFFGLIDQPYIGERFEGAPDGAWLTGPRGKTEIRSRRSRTLAEATLSSTFPEIGTPAERVAFEAVAAQAKLTRYGMDCYAYALVAAGHIDVVIETGLAPYDIQAPIAVIQAAGGVITDWEGRPAHDGGRVICAGSPELHAEALAVLQSRA